ncbi:MAG: type III-A CRISPR-associated protein Cas10/Csm1 [Thermoplasmata archaeon]
MNRYEDKDEVVLVLSALLHDIGKIQQKYNPGTTHQELSYNFIKNMANISDEAMKREIEDLVKYHHENEQYLSDSRKKDQKFIEKLRVLKDADVLSASHDRNDQPQGTESIKLLKKIFSEVNVFDTNMDQNKTDQKNDYFPPYMIHDFLNQLNKNDNVDELFGYTKDSFSVSQKYNDIYKYTFNKLNTLDFSYGNYSEFVNTATNILMDSCRLIPSAYYYSEPNIPLFDHLKLTAAISLAKWRNNDQFLLILGDLSGIQNFIFRYYNSGKADDKASKRLRGRSFMLSILIDAIVSYLLKELQLYEFNVLYDSAGGFLILSDYNENSDKKLEELRKNIERVFMEEFRGLNISIAWQSIKFSDLPTNDKKRDDGKKLSETNFSKDLDKLYDEVNIRKNKLYKEILQSKNLFESNFILEKYSDSPNNKLCEICGMRYGKDGKCYLCSQEEKIGQEIVKSNLMYKSTQEIGSDDIIFSFTDTFKLHYSLNPPSKELENVEIISINDPEFKGFEKYLPSNINYSKKSWKFLILGNFVPVKENENNVKSIKDLLGKSDESQDLKNRYLGIFKSDIDNMSVIIKFGFKPYTLSRYSTYSFFISLFFSGIINHLARKNEIYIVFSGGDDLIAIGEINNIFDFAKDINIYFRKWVRNSEITMSAGIAVTDDSFPLRRGIEIAEEEMEHSKKDMKNKITVFNTSMTWGNLGEDQFEENLSIGNAIYNSMDKGYIGKSFPYFLIDLDRYNPYKKQRISNSDKIIIPDYFLYYYINRNWGGKEEAKNELYQNLIKEKNFKYIKFPAYYAILKIRKNRPEEEKGDKNV